MLKPKKILVPVDGSIPSKNAAKYAAYLAKDIDATLVLLNVWEPVAVTIGGDAAKQLKAEMEAASIRALEAVKRVVEECGGKVEIMSRSGTPAYAILDAQEETDAELIVMGSRGLTSIEGFFLGSVANKVLQSAACPVLVTRNIRKRYPEEACFT